MTDINLPLFNRNAINPVSCLMEGWQLIKNQYWLFLGMSLVGVLAGSMVPLGVLLGPMMCGLHLAFFRTSQGEPVKFEELFKGFDYFMQSVVATLIQIVPLMLLMIPTYVGGVVALIPTIIKANSHHRMTPSDLTAFAILYGTIFGVALVGSLIVGVFFVFTYPLIVDRGLPGVAAVKTSARAAVANLVGVFSLTVLIMCLSFAGMLFCYVGALLVLPIGLAARHVAYKQVFGFATTTT